MEENPQLHTLLSYLEEAFYGLFWVLLPAELVFSGNAISDLTISFPCQDCHFSVQHEFGFSMT